MTSPNPFAQHAPAAPATPAAGQQVAGAGASNPFAQAAPAPAAPAAPANPFGGGVPAAPAQPYGSGQWQGQQAAPAAPAPQAAPVAAAAPPVLDPNALGAAAPPPASYAKGPELADMYSRLVLIFPLSLEIGVPRNPKFISEADRLKGNTTQDRLTATLVILDSGPGTPPGGMISWGGNPHALGGSPHTNHDPLPYVVKGKWISQSKLVAQCKPFLPQAPGAPAGMVAGRLAKEGPEANAPWYLVAATDAELDLARTYLRLVGQGQYPHPLA